MPTILIVDNEPAQRRYVRTILSEDPSLTFLEAPDEPHALRLAQLHHPDMIIFDLGGLAPTRSFSREQFQAARLVRHTPVLFTATWSHTNKTLTTILASGRPLLFKPFEAAELLAAVHHALRRTGLPARMS